MELRGEKKSVTVWHASKDEKWVRKTAAWAPNSSLLSLSLFFSCQQHFFFLLWGQRTRFQAIADISGYQETKISLDVSILARKIPGEGSIWPRQITSWQFQGVSYKKCWDWERQPPWPLWFLDTLYHINSGVRWSLQALESHSTVAEGKFFSVLFFVFLIYWLLVLWLRS